MIRGFRGFLAGAAGAALLLCAGLSARTQQAGTLKTGAAGRKPPKPASAAPARRSLSADAASPAPGRIGGALSDPRNPIVQLFGGRRLDLWSLRKPRNVTPPTPRNMAWVKTPVDRFVLAGLEARGLAPSPPADRRTLIRRLYFDFLGLPPTPEEIKAFVADAAPDAYERLVERLLASPHYGERWGRHWLDVARYADTNGFERDEFRPNTYRYRDYVIRAFNQDKPYNQFVREQLAGDELAGSDKPQSQADIDKLAATGYLRLGQYDSTGSIFEEDKRGRDQLMADLANTTGSAFLGLTVACANCHNHKYDPISQADHFRLRAFFAGVKFRDDICADPPALRDEIDKQNAALDAQKQKLETQRTLLLAPAKTRIASERRAALPADIQALLQTEESKRSEDIKTRLKPFLAKLDASDEDTAKALSEADKKQVEALSARMGELDKQRRTHAALLAMTDAGSSAPKTLLFAQGDYQQPKEEIAPGFLSVFDPNPASIQAPASGNSTGRRLALANWIASPDNPYTARVMVNRLWQHHFGRGIVATPNDFGYSGARPSNPALLDWLANEFVRGGWSVKRMHRLMALSATYRQASVITPRSRTVDPDNLLCGRQNIRRHDAETLRDSLLAVSGLLLPVGDGPPRWPPVQQDLLDAQPSILETHSDADARKRLEGWYAEPVEQTDVRTVFLIQKRCLSAPFLQPFDLQDTTISCAARTNTTVAPQALTLLNNDLSLRAARAFATRVRREAGDIGEKQVRRAVWLAVGREPDREELAVSLNLLARHAAKHAQTGEQAVGQAASEKPERAALSDLCRMLLNINEFVYVD